MKAKITRPLKRLILAILSAHLLAGCSGIQSNSLYQNWERQAYSAYRIAAPVHNASVLPSLLRTVAVPSRQVAAQRAVASTPDYRYNDYGNPPAAQPLMRPQPPLPEPEQQYIADFYGI